MIKKITYQLSEKKQMWFFSGCLFFNVILLFMLLNSCAIKVNPTGGNKDVTPPKVLKTEPENFSVNFNKKSFKIKFDEYVNVRDISKQLIVSPMLNNLPDVKLKGREIEVEISDTLKPNTTYTFNFGKAIVDVHEGNELTGFQYVFATGDHLDSLEIHGNVVNAQTLKPEKDVSVFLFSSGDSITVNRRPEYYTATDEAGNFTIRNLRADKYQLAALKDDNSNFVYDISESIAFLNTEIELPDSTHFNLKLFPQPELRTRLLKAFVQEKNKVLISFSTPADKLELELLSEKPKESDLIFDYSTERDSVFIWINDTTADSLNAAIKINGLSIDTITLKLKTENKFAVGRGNAAGFFSASMITKDGFFEMSEKPVLHFSRPLGKINTSEIILMQDSVLQKTDGFKSLDSLKQNYLIEYKFNYNHKYVLIVPKGCASDFTGMPIDSIVLNFKTREERDYGSIELTFNDATNANCIIQLVTTDEKPVRTFINSANKKISMPNLIPGNYRIRCINDLDKNGKWNSGNYFGKLQPEPVIYYSETINVRANWDVEIIWNLK